MVAVFTPWDPSGSDAQNNWVRIETTFVAIGLDAIDSHLLLGLQHCHIVRENPQEIIGPGPKEWDFA